MLGWTSEIAGAGKIIPVEHHLSRADNPKTVVHAQLTIDMQITMRVSQLKKMSCRLKSLSHFLVTENSIGDARHDLFGEVLTLMKMKYRKN